MVKKKNHGLGGGDCGILLFGVETCWFAPRDEADVSLEDKCLWISS